VNASVPVDGEPLDLSATCSVTVNSFLASGGDNFTVFRQGTNRVVGPVDLDAPVDHVKALPATRRPAQRCRSGPCPRCARAPEAGRAHGLTS
jgi:2',3'-cyclic-nucleotide 2'-phosphodiesterase (5'-nucleotidase family)